jgi:hypothetical protein
MENTMFTQEEISRQNVTKIEAEKQFRNLDMEIANLGGGLCYAD